MFLLNFPLTGFVLFFIRSSFLHNDDEKENNNEYEQNKSNHKSSTAYHAVTFECRRVRTTIHLRWLPAASLLAFGAVLLAVLMNFAGDTQRATTV